jgi:hypothetical protein
LRKIADAWGISLEWLVFGRGQPEQPRPVQGRYPHRVVAAQICREARLSEEAIRSVEEQRYDFDGDPTVLWWIHEIEQRALEMSGLPRGPQHTPRPPSRGGKK